MSVATYYDSLRDRLIQDYQAGNARVVAAIAFAREALAGADSILDVGCGIGWTSAELAATGAHVTGLDISPALTETARDLFGDRCTFETVDFTEWRPRAFDAVLMVDSYEHFPAAARPLVHRRLRQTGATRVAVTVPTPEAQQYARDHGIPLQPIDENVTDRDLEQLADDLGLHVAVNELVTVWRRHDYRHVLIA